MRACNEDESSKHGGTDPWEVFTQLIILVVEGRTPGGDRGYHAGPHCLRPQQPIGNRHECNLNSTTCLKADILLKQLRLMWEVGVGASVEVLLAPDCNHGVQIANTLDTTSAPLPTLRLLEQWNFTISDKRKPTATSSGWALVAAVRSYLHFSQLSAWLSSSGGSSPPNVLYRLAVSSPMFGSKFEGIQEVHSFPIANMIPDMSMKVVVRTIPRTEKIPNIICEEGHASSSHDSIWEETSRYAIYDRSDIDLSAGAESDYSLKDHRSDEDLRRSMMKAKLTDAVVRRSESPDTQLGQSLLDPPNCMSRIPRRFQSPSRSGSPSLETPEHLLCKVRQSGPSHARPPGTVPICQPIVIPARQPLNPYPWTRTCYPSFEQNLCQYQPKVIGVTPHKVFPQQSASPYTFYDCENSVQNIKSKAFVRPTPQYWQPKTSYLDSSVNKEERVSSVFGPKLHNIDGPIASSSKDQWRSFKSYKNEKDKSEDFLSGRKIDCDNILGSFIYSENRSVKQIESSQGTKRKGIHKKESPKKRESPPHSSQLENCGLNSSFPILKEQMWPHSSEQGKHIRTSANDFFDKATAAIEIMPKTGQMDTSRGGIPKLFDLTPKETKEILDVLRQSTPVPPLRINRTEIEHNQTEFIFSHTSKLTGYCQNGNQRIKCKNINLSNSEKRNQPTKEESSNRTEVLTFENKVRFTKGGQCNEPSTSANSCDNSIKKPLDSSQSLPLPSCSTGVKRKLLNDMQGSSDNTKDFTAITKCIQAKTVKEKTNFYTAFSYPACSPMHMSVILPKKSSSLNPTRMKRSSPISFDLEEEMKSPKAKKPLFNDIKKDRDNEENSDVIEINGKYSTKTESFFKPSLISVTDNYEKSKSENRNIEKTRTVIQELLAKRDSKVKEDVEVEEICHSKGLPIPSASDQVSFRRSFDSATNRVFHNKTGLPLTSSPAPMRKGNSFDYDSSLISVAAIKCALRSCDDEGDDKLIKINSPSEAVYKPVMSLSAPATVTCSNLLGNFEESVLNGRLEPFSTVHGFKAEIAASGSFCPKHVAKPVTVFFYTLCDNYQMSSPYMGHVDLSKKGYQIPSKGTVQVTLFNPHGTVVKMFVVMYDLTDMPPNSKTFLRQRTLNMPVGETDTNCNAHQWLRYLIHLRFASSRSGKIYLHTDIRMMIFRKADVDAALLHQTDVPYEVRSFTHGPTNPRFSPRK